MVQAQIEETQNGGSDSSEVVIDLFGMIQRHYLLLTLCSLLSLIAGIVYCVVADKVYESTAQVMIQQSQTPVFNEQTQQDRSGMTLENELETHKLVVRSPLILDRAVTDGKLTELQTIAGIDADDLLEHWQENLAVNLPDEKARVLAISYRSKSPDDCRQVVDAIVGAYDAHLGESSAELGREVTSLISRGKDELLQQLHTQEKEYEEFQRNSPLLWRGGEGVNLFQERQAEIETRRKEILVEKSMLEARITGVAQAIVAGGNEAKAVFLEAMLELRGTDEQEGTIERETSRGYGLELSREYMELMARESELSMEYGDGYPELISLRAKIRKMRKAVEASIGRSLNSDGMAVSQDATRDELQSQNDYIKTYYSMLKARMRALNMQLQSLNRDFDIASKSADEVHEYIARDRTMRADQERTKSMFDAVVSRLEEINIIQDYGGETMKVLATASLGEQVWPSIPIVLAFSLLIGGMIGSAWALLRSLTEQIFEDPKEIRQVLQAPVLGQIPLQKKKMVKTDPSLVGLDPMIGVVHDSGSRYAEAFRGVRTAVHFSTQSSGWNVLQVTSASPGDGKSTTAANLSASFAKANRKVILIDADMRRPSIHKLMGARLDLGLSNYLRNEADWVDLVQKSEVKDLDVISAGSLPKNPAELLTSGAFDELVEQLRQQYDIVIIDSPPLLAVSDPSIIAPRVDGVLLVIRMRDRVRVATERARSILNEVGAKLLGAVVNGLTSKERGYGYGPGYKSGYSYGYGYNGAGSYYGPDKSKQKRKSPAVLTDHLVNSDGQSVHGSQVDEVTNF